MLRKHPLIHKVVRCGAMPLYLLYLKNHQSKGHCLMLCKASRLNRLLKNKDSVSTLQDYGKVVFLGSGQSPSDLTKALVKARYDIDLDEAICCWQ
jgi:hypothetical protein